jgi:FkbM family methyltransferase
MKITQGIRCVGKALAVIGIRLVSRQKSSVTLSRIDDGWRVRNTETKEYYDFPSFPQSIHVAHIGDGYAEFLSEKYQIDGFVEVEEGDHVVDIGLYVGAFISSVEARADQVSAMEPSPETARILERRWQDDPNIDIINLAAWNQPDSLELQLGPDASDNSTINVDKGNQVGTVTVDAVRLDDQFDQIDFLKLEAEGAEPEVLEGAVNCDIHKIAVDASPERKGETTIGPVVEWFKTHGYEFQIRENTVFAVSRKWEKNQFSDRGLDV